MTHNTEKGVRYACYTCGKMFFVVTGIREKGHFFCCTECHKEYKAQLKANKPKPPKQKRDGYDWLRKIDYVLKMNNGKYVN